MGCLVLQGITRWHCKPKRVQRKMRRPPAKWYFLSAHRPTCYRMKSVSIRVIAEMKRNTYSNALRYLSALSRRTRRKQRMAVIKSGDSPPSAIAIQYGAMESKSMSGKKVVAYPSRPQNPPFAATSSNSTHVQMRSTYSNVNITTEIASAYSKKVSYLSPNRSHLLPKHLLSTSRVLAASRTTFRKIRSSIVYSSGESMVPSTFSCATFRTLPQNDVGAGGSSSRCASLPKNDEPYS